MMMDFNHTLKYIVLIALYIFIFSLYAQRNNIGIYIGNSFKNFYHLPVKVLKCYYNNISYECYFKNKKNKLYNAAIYNGNRRISEASNYTYNIVFTTEKLSQVYFMKEIGEGKSRKFKLAVDYRLFSNNYHISRNIYSYYNISQFVMQSNNNYNNISSFLKRKNCIYIQRVYYKNRHRLVKEMMKYMDIDSYGKDLNNQQWPINISKNDKIKLIKQYKFCIAIENSIISWNNDIKKDNDEINNDYVTEKLTDCLLAGSIPIYFGPKNINKFLPHPDAIVNIRNFKSIKSLVDYIQLIKNNRTALFNHLLWHNNISAKWFNRFNSKYTFSYCMICNMVYINAKRIMK